MPFLRKVHHQREHGILVGIFLPGQMQRHEDKPRQESSRHKVCRNGNLLRRLRGTDCAMNRNASRTQRESLPAPCGETRVRCDAAIAFLLSRSQHLNQLFRRTAEGAMESSIPRGCMNFYLSSYRKGKSRNAKASEDWLRLSTSVSALSTLGSGLAGFPAQSELCFVSALRRRRA